MNRKLVLAVLLALVPSTSSALFGPDNYWECLLEDLRHVPNDVAATAVIQACQKRFPTTEDPTKKTGFLQPSARECVLRHTKTTTSNRAAGFMRGACFRLYEDK